MLRSKAPKASSEAETSAPPNHLDGKAVDEKPFLFGMQDGLRRTLPKATILAGGGADNGGAG